MVISMSLTQIQKLQLNKQADRILHMPGNLTGNRQQLEMTFVFHMGSEREYLKTTAADIVASLKAHDRIFQNVRSNVVRWRTGEKLSTEVMPMSFIQMGKPFLEDKKEDSVDKPPVLDELCAYLKMYHARSKCILLIMEGEYCTEDKRKTAESLNPFLKTKLLLVTPGKITGGNAIFMEMLR